MVWTFQKLILLFCLLGFIWAGAAHAAPISDPLKNFFVTDGQVNAIERVGGLLYVGGAFTMVNRYSGSGVVINTAGGAANLDWPAVNGPVLAVQKDGQGGWYIGGNFTVVGTVTRNGLAHILSDKSVDPNWDPNPNPTRRVRALLKVGTILYVGGDFENLNGTTRNHIAAFNTTTGQLTDWDPAADDDVYCLAVSGSTLYVGGGFSHIGGEARANIAALSTSTGLATNWDPNTDNKIVRVILVSGNGNTVYVGGSFTHFGLPSPDGQDRNGIAALRASDGQPTDWDPNASSTVFALALSGTTLYVGGGFATIGGQPRDHIAALSTSTGEALDWNPGAQLGDVRTILLVGNTVYIGGGFTVIGGGAGGVGGTPRNHLAAVNATTGAVKGWNPQANDSVFTLLKFKQTLFTGGAFTSVGGQTPRNNIAAFDAATGLLSSVDPNANGPVHALTAFGNTLYVAGEFTTLQGGASPRNRLAALNASDGTPTAWNPNADGPVRAVAVAPDGLTVYAGGDFTHINGTTTVRNHIAALTLQGVATAWDAGTSGGPDGGRVSALATSSNKVYVGGSFTTIGGLARPGLAFVRGTGTTGPCPGTSCPVLAWNPRPDGPIYTILVGGVTLCSADSGATPTIYVGGDFTTLNGVVGGAQTRNGVAAVKSSSSTEDIKICDWNPGANGAVRALARSGDTLFMGGDFTAAGGESPRNHLAAVDVVTGSAKYPSSGPDASWNPGPDNSVRALEVLDSVGLPGMVYVGGSFSTMSGSTTPPVGLPRTNLAAFSFTTLDSMISLLSRSVPVNDPSYPAQALLVVSNRTSIPATQVAITKKSPLVGEPVLHFWTYDGTNCVAPDTAVDIPPLGQHTFCFSIVPNFTIDPSTELSLGVEGGNTTAARSISGWNTLTLIATDPPPQTTADIFTSTSATDGTVSFPESIKLKGQPACLGQTTFDIGSFNLGVGQPITVSLRGTGSVKITTDPLNPGSVQVGICQLNTATGQCMAPADSTVSFPTFDAFATPTFRVFITGEVDQAIPGEFEADRLFISFKDNNGRIRGLASVVVETVGTASCR